MYNAGIETECKCGAKILVRSDSLKECEVEYQAFMAEHHNCLERHEVSSLRERAAIAAMQSLLPSLSERSPFVETISRLAVEYADGLITELNKKGESNVS